MTATEEIKLIDSAEQLDALIENGYSQMINFVDGSVKDLSK